MSTPPQERGIDRGGINVRTVKGPILNASELEKASARLSVPPPEICFGHNLLSLEHPCFVYTFDAVSALAQVSPRGDDRVQVAHADEWAKSRNLGPADGVKTVQKWDWTYTTTYEGHHKLSDARRSFQAAPPSHPGIPLKKLSSQQEPILFFEEVTLFEDELHDCGMANLIVKVRVMPSFVFVLSRFFLRIDRVLFRIFDVRLYHAFGSNEIVREVRGREAPYEAVKQRLPSDRPDDLTPLTDSAWVANAIGMLEDTRPARMPSPRSASSVRDYLANQGADRHTRQSPITVSPEARSTSDHSSCDTGRNPWTGHTTRLEVLTLQ